MPAHWIPDHVRDAGLSVCRAYPVRTVPGTGIAGQTLQAAANICRHQVDVDPARLVQPVGFLGQFANIRAGWPGAERGNRFGYWTPSALLTELAASGRRISDWRPTAGPGTAR